MTNLDYGTDIAFNSSYSDIDESLILTDNEYVVMQAVIMRLTSNAGSLWYDEDYGYNLYNLLKAPLSLTDGVTVLTSRIEQEITKDERIQSAAVRINSMDALNSILSISIDITLNQGKSFNLVFSLLDDSINIESKQI